MARRLKDLGMILLGVWLLLQGTVPLLDLHFTGLRPLMHVLAIGAGLLILWSR